MIGDDLVNDVGGAQDCGFFGVLVRTGKYRYFSACQGIPCTPYSYCEWCFGGSVHHISYILLYVALQVPG